MLSRGISLLVESNMLQPMASPKSFKVPSHVLYVDNIMVFF